jgi:hypothetical protein
MNKKSSVSTLGYVAILITVTATTGVILFIVFHNVLLKDKFLGTETYKLTYQFLLIVVVGGCISLLFTLYIKARENLDKEIEHEKEYLEKQKEKQENKDKEVRQIQHQFYNDFLQAYNNVKKIRRFLRATARKISTNASGQQVIHIKVARYSELMSELISLQLRFEYFYDEIDSNKGIFKGVDNIVSLLANIKNIEEYLNSIVGEYESCYNLYPNQSFIDDVTYIPVDSLPKLSEFIEKYKDAVEFKQQFKDAADRVSGTVMRFFLND